MKKFLGLLFSGVFFAFSASANQSDITKIENYLNNITSLKADFVQMASNGGIAEGKIYIAKPSKIRMEYTAPEELLVVGNGDYIIYNDKELNQITNIDYKDIPATTILTEKIKIDGKKLKVVDLYKDAGQTTIIVEMPENKNVKPITLTFDNNPFRLKQWRVIDQQNIEVTVSLFNEEQDKELSESLFKFDRKSSKSPQKAGRRK